MSTSIKAPEGHKHPVDEYPGHARVLLLGFQHVLAAYAGAVAVPLFVGWALVDAGKMQPSDIPHLIAADLFVAGIATVVQSVGIWRFGVRLPLIQGCTFSAAIPMVTIGTQYGVPAIYGSVIASGIFMIVFAPLFASLLRFFPPLVTGTVLLIIGTTLMPVEASWVLFRFLYGGQLADPGVIIHIDDLCRALISEGFVEALVVPPVDPVQRRKLDLGQ